MNFLEFLGDDASIMVLTGLDDPADLARACSVSKSWYQFVTRNGLFKKLCQRMCPEISIFAHVTEEIGSAKKVECGSSSDTEWDMLKREHRVYKYLCCYLVSRMRNEGCILEPIEASSTDNYPDESIKHTLEPSDRGRVWPSYWSSKGECDPTIPEYLTYRLKSKLCVVTEIKIHPFKAFFQFNHPIYSSEAVRFRMGYSKTPEETKGKVLSGQRYNTDDKYRWTYVSSQFPMNQENSLQSFKLPRPIICTGGILQVELLRRVQKQEIDGLFYICICHVKVIGSNLSPVFDCDMPRESITSPVLKYFPEAKVDNLEDNESEARRQSSWRAFTTRLKEFIF